MTDLIDANLPIEAIPTAELRPHARNYQSHPEDQLEHLVESLKEHGFYRPVVIARDGTILAGHGLVLAAAKLGIESVPAIRLDLEPNDPRALKVLLGDNEIRHLAERDDRALSELLKEVSTADLAGLLGTGYDGMMLANLAYVTRPESEIASFDEAAQWAGMPEYAPEEELRISVRFRTPADRLAFCQRLAIEVPEKTGSIWWPSREVEDNSALRVAG